MPIRRTILLLAAVAWSPAAIAQPSAAGKAGSAPIPHVTPVLIPDNASVGWSFDLIDADAAPLDGTVRKVMVTLVDTAR